MFPNPKAQPAGFVEPLVRVAITRPVFRDLVRPVLGVGGRDCVVFRTAMPEAAIEEDRDPSPGKTKSAVRRSPLSGCADTL